MFTRILGNQSANMEERMSRLEDNLERITTVLDKMLQHDITTPANTTLKLKEEIEALRVKSKTQIIESLEMIDDKHRQPTVDDAKHFLTVRSIGKSVDETYIAFCGAILREYFTKRAKVSNALEDTISHSALQMHLHSIDHKYQYDLEKIQRFNDNIQFIKRCSIRLFNYVFEIPIFTRQLALNCGRPAYTYLQTKPRWLIITAVAAPIIAYVAGYSIARLSMLAMNSIIIPSVTKPFKLAYKIAIAPLSLMNMTRKSLDDSVSLLISKHTPNHTLMTSISQHSTTAVKGIFIGASTTVCLVGKTLNLIFAPLLNWKNYQTASTKLLDLSKQGIQHSILLSEDILNRSKEPSKIVFNSAKELTTKLGAKSIDYLKDGNTILNATILPSTHMLLSKCCKCAIDFTRVAIPIAQNCASCAKEQLTTAATAVTEHATPYVAHACQATSTQVSAIASSTITSFVPPFQNLASHARLLSTVMTRLYSPIPPSPPTPSPWYSDLITNVQWSHVLRIVYLL
nr:hypothetical protein [Dipteran tombus-related virus]